MARPGRFHALATMLLVAVSAACGKPEPTPERIVEPELVAVIETFDIDNDAFTVVLESGEHFRLDRDEVWSVGGSGDASRGNLFLYGEDESGPWYATFDPDDPDDPVLGQGWLAYESAWVRDTDVLFTSGLRLEKAPTFEVAPDGSLSETGYVVGGDFLIDAEGRLVAVRDRHLITGRAGPAPQMRSATQ